jgi:hypothetical protein
MANVLLVRPANDEVASVLSNWANNLKNRPLAAPNTVTTDLVGPHATRNAVEAALPGHAAVFFFGHGISTMLLGGTGAVIDKGNIALAANKAIIAIACSSAETLGRLAVRQFGVSAYLGFSRELVFFADPDHLFEQAFCAGAAALLDGRTMRTVRLNMKLALLGVANHYRQDGRSDAVMYYLAAFWDASHICLRGDQNHRL